MAKVTGRVSREVIQRFKGTLDFYILRGEQIVRRWPNRAVRVQGPLELRAHCNSLRALRTYVASQQSIKDEYGALVRGYGWSRRDYFYVHYFGTVARARLLAWNHHPPQPPECPGGNGHYFALLYTWADTRNTAFFNLYFRFDSVLRYRFHFVRHKPIMQLHGAERAGQLRDHGWSGLYEPLFFSEASLTNFGPPTYKISLVGGDTENVGRWYGWISAQNPVTGHPSLSVTPMFTFDVPRGPYPLGIRIVDGLHFLNFLGETYANPDEFPQPAIPFPWAPQLPVLSAS